MTSKDPLLQKIRRLIESNGPLSVADYMALCLCDPEHGYYMRGDPFGIEGDFITAPEVSQMFGEIVGAWLIETWRLIGAPSPVHLVELGPGRGTLMADILKVADNAPDFRAAASIHLVETSLALTSRQVETLRGRQVEWHSAFSGVPAGPVLVVANEFFDALPIRQFVKVQGIWRERVIGLDHNDKLVFGIGAGRLDERLQSEEGEVLEVRPSGEALTAEISGRIRAHSGAALIIDYGHAEDVAGETLQAVRRHTYVDPLEAPGEADLTAHVDFAALQRAAKAEGIQAHGPIPQSEFLLKLGLLERAGQLGATAGESAREEIRSAVERLAGPTQMGNLFKVMALTPDGLVPPPFASPV